MIYRAGQFLIRDGDGSLVRVEAVEGDRLTISAVEFPLAPWWSVPQGRLLGEWREVPPPPVMIDNYEPETAMPDGMTTLSVTMADADWQAALDEHMELKAREDAGGPAFLELMGELRQAWEFHRPIPPADSPKGQAEIAAALQSGQEWGGRSS